MTDTDTQQRDEPTAPREGDQTPQRRFVRGGVVLAMLLAVGVVALSVRLVYLNQISPAPEFQQLRGDARAYDAWAHRIVEGDWLSRSVGVFYQAPLYPYFLAGVYALPGDEVATARGVQIALGVLACMILAFATTRLFDGRWSIGLIAGVLLACYPPAMFFDLQIDKTSLDLILISILLLCLTFADRQLAWPFIGLVGGLLTLTRENALALFVVILIWLAIHFRQRSARWRLGCAALAVLGIAIVLLPVSVRNKVVGGEWHLSTAQFGPNFYIGNNASADGLYNPLRPGRGDARYERTDATELAEQATGRALSPGEVSAYWAERAFSDIREHPAQWSALTLRKAMMVWTATEVADSGDVDTHAAWSPLLATLDRFWHFGVLLPLAGAGVVLAWNDRRRLWLIYVLILVYAASNAAFYVFGRYRFPLVPLLMPIAAAAVVYAFAALYSMRRSRLLQLLIAIVVAVALAGLSNASAILPERIRGADAYNRALAHDRRGEKELAIAWYDRAIEINPRLADAHNNLGLIRADEGNLDAAIAHFAESLNLNPGDAFAQNNLGMALARAGRMQQALVHFENAVALDPTMTAARYNLALALMAEQRYAQAVQEFERVVQEQPNHAEARRYLGALRARLPATQPRHIP